MKNYYAKKVASGAFAVILAVTVSQPLVAEELDTEIPSAGATAIIEDYIANNETGAADILTLLPKEEETTQVQQEANKAETTTQKDNSNSEDKYFENIAIAEVAGGEEGYVNVRKKASTESKIVGKIYNNCGATILEEKNGWYKIKSGNCTGYIKAEYFVVGNKAKEYALDEGYVYANIKGTGIHARQKPTTESGVVTNVYHNENFVIKKFSKNGDWAKLKIELDNGDKVTGWVSSEFVNVSVNMESVITIKEEKEQIRKQQEAERAAAEAERAAAEAAEAERQEAANQNTNTNTNTNNSYSNSSSSSSNSSSSSSNSSSSSSSSSNSSSSVSSNTSSSSGSGKGSAVVAYAKQFLGNPYVYGGSSLTKGTDCSGFTMSVYAHFGYGLNRSSYTQVYNGSSVSLSSLQPGDLLFYKYGGSTISHVAIYIGGGQIIHASTERTGIIISGMGSPCAARRIIN